MSTLIHKASATAAALVASAAVMTGTLAGATSAVASDLTVRYDQATLLRLPRQISEVIVGNPSVADVSVQGGNMLVVTGKTFGVTNVIALDAARNVIQDQRIIVRQDDARVVNLHRGVGRASYNCAPNCNSTLSVGDAVDYFENIHKSSEKKVKFSDGGADAGASGGQ